LSDISDDKLKKDAERLAKSWKKHSEEKEAFRKKESEYQAKLAEYDNKVKKYEEQSVNSKYSPEELRQWAKKWDDEGEIDKAKAARKEANDIEDKAIRLRTERARQQEEFANTWKSTEKQLYTEYPDLAKEGSELRDKTAELLSRNDTIAGFIHSQPTGLKMAVRLADLMIKADLASDLQKENAGFKNKIIELEKKLSPSASVPGKSKEVKNFDDMSLDEQKAALRSQLADSLV
jgi:cobalamin biosynthesis protein CobT